MTLHGGFTPLIDCVWRRRKNTFRYLLRQGVNPNIELSCNRRCVRKKLKALGVVARLSSVHWDELNDTETLEILLNAGAETRGTAALHIASFLGSLPKMQCLIEHGTDVNEVLEQEVLTYFQLRSKGLSSPLHWAIQGGNKDAIRFLLTKNPDLDIQDNEGVSVRAYLEEYDVGSLVEDAEAAKA
ncbi:uncharacterized protein K452DRAFT_313779 [Aplosporella prunicola CBS 121167]|uniref:Uncharacterized protein n=1 Tax=Aplosporella prunicola CBS 121167 TaxID=1176127 RepID=A0A6A6AXP0_9PEZI|nr:uncharacterized protein K452DRAFT_313779 [Aplosporella prunicola CBS 121167]KAF2135714.1 hypothetical protein K452DRAFT_313779 [Aplosporella prunicola CBS 121167]